MWNGTIFVDLDWPLNASSLLSASAELLVYTSLSSLMMWNLQSYPTAVWNERMWHFRGIKTYSDPSYIFSGVRSPQLPWSMPLFVCTSFNALVRAVVGEKEARARAASCPGTRITSSCGEDGELARAANERKKIDSPSVHIHCQRLFLDENLARCR